MSSDVLTGAEFERPVVVVEDNPRVRSFLERVVATRFHPISCATFGEAIQALDELSAPPLAMIVDVNLGTTYGNGLDIAAHARRRFGGAVPVLVLTAALDWEISERVNELRIELLVKPQASDAVRRFLDRAETRHDWRTADVIDLARALAEFARDHGLTDRQSTFLTAMMQAAERGEPMAINANTRKAGMRRLLSKTGHATFDAIRLDIKRRATQLS